MILDLYSYIGKVIYKEEPFNNGLELKTRKQMYLICGVDKLLNSFICVRFSELACDEKERYVIIKDVIDKEIISLFEAYDICFTYIKPIIEIHNLYKKYKMFDEKKKKDFRKTLRRFSDTMYQLYCFKGYNCTSFMGKEWRKARNEMIEKERNKWKKGLKRIKKRTYHYFSDEVFDLVCFAYPVSLLRG